MWERLSPLAPFARIVLRLINALFISFAGCCLLLLCFPMLDTPNAEFLLGSLMMLGSFCVFCYAGFKTVADADRTQSFRDIATIRKALVRSKDDD